MAACSGSCLWISTSFFKFKKNKKLHGEALNFGPNHKKNYSVISLVKLMKKNWKDI